MLKRRGFSEKKLTRAFQKIPYEERVILLPQCLRSNKCGAGRAKYGVLQCEECGQYRDDGKSCPIAEMRRIADEVGYGAVYIFTGGSGIVPFFRENGLPKGVLAVACPLELDEGYQKLKPYKIPVQMVHLTQEGCAETHFCDAPEEFRERWREILTRYPPAENS